MGVVCKGIVTGAVRVECEDLRPRRLRVQPGEPAFRAAVDGYTMADEEVRTPRTRTTDTARRTERAVRRGPTPRRVPRIPRDRRFPQATFLSSLPSRLPRTARFRASRAAVHCTPRRGQRQETGMTGTSNQRFE